jgi:hypothetical protein
MMAIGMEETLFVIRHSSFVKDKNIKKPMAMQLLRFNVFYELRTTKNEPRLLIDIVC